MAVIGRMWSTRRRGRRRETTPTRLSPIDLAIEDVERGGVEAHERWSGFTDRTLSISPYSLELILGVERSFEGGRLMGKRMKQTDKRENKKRRSAARWSISGR